MHHIRDTLLKKGGNFSPLPERMGVEPIQLESAAGRGGQSGNKSVLVIVEGQIYDKRGLAYFRVIFSKIEIIRKPAACHSCSRIFYGPWPVSISPDAARQVILLVTSDLMGTVPIHRRHFAELLYATAGIEADVGRHMSGDVGMAFDNLMSSYMVLHSQCGQDIPSNIYSSLIWKLGTCLAVVEHSPKSLAGARMMNGQF
ncbi:hypothetical protein C8R43DRAFT_1186574 [Mycena crocata]|nr:hypothetical protein C8R43DRAFT_1186574 [Mycena crocata]